MEKEEKHQNFSLADYFSFDIYPYTVTMKFDSGDMLLREGEKPRVLYYLEEGRAKLFLSQENGRISLINFLDAPCFIGEMELLGAQEAANGVAAVTPCICSAVRIEECRDKLLQDTKFLRYLCRFLSQKAIGNTYNYSRNQSYPLEVCLANFILMTSSGRMYRERHTEASEFLGVTYRHFLYVLADFVKRGFLEKTRSGYYIRDEEALRKLSGRN